MYFVNKQVLMSQIKIPNTIYPVAPFILNRWSARSFSPKEISTDQIYTLFEAASWAASSMNEQPWLYFYASKNTDGFKKLFSCLLKGNQPWAKNASVLILSLARKNFKRNNNFNLHYMHDVGAANTTLLLQAAHMGILGHMMGGIDFQQIKQEFNLPDDLEISCILALGYPDNADKLEEPFKTRELTERKRNHLNEFVFKV